MANFSQALLGTLRCPVTGSTVHQDGERLLSDTPGPDGQPVSYAIEEGIPLMVRAEQLAG